MCIVDLGSVGILAFEERVVEDGGGVDGRGQAGFCGVVGRGDEFLLMSVGILVGGQCYGEACSLAYRIVVHFDVAMMEMDEGIHEVEADACAQ